MSSKLCTVATFMTPEEAQLASNALTAAKVRTVIADDAVVGMQWGMANAMGGVNLQVGEPDVERARAILDSHRQSIELDSAATDSWQCPGCEAMVDSGFDVCWSCGETSDGREDPDFAKAVAATQDDGCSSFVAGDDASAQFSDDGESVQAQRLLVVGLVVAGLLGFMFWSMSR